MNEGKPSKLSELFRDSELIDRLDAVMPGLVYVFDLIEQRNVYANQALSRLLGYSPQEVAALGERLLPTIVHPEDLGRTLAHHAHIPHAPTGEVIEVEFRVKDASGGWRWLHCWETVLEHDARGRPRRLLGIAQDVTGRVDVEEELRQSRQQLAESEQRWRSIAENPFDFVVVIDRSFKFTYVNFALPGLKLEDLIGKQSPLDFATGVDHQVMKSAFELVFSEGRPTSYEVYVEPLQKWYHSLVGPIKAGDVVTHASIMTRDISAERLMQAQARQAEQQLRQMESKLAQTAKLEAVGQLAGGIAHDFNNLLTGIGGVVELLAMRMAADDPSLLDVLDLRQAVERGAGLTRQLLAFSRQQPIAPTVLELNALLEETSRLLRRLIGEDIELLLVPCAEEVHVRADRTQLEQVLLNLAVNGRDAMAGGGRLQVELTRERIDASERHRHPDARPGQFARVRVSDNGTGMDEATIGRIFEPFFTTKPIGAGTGLGLSMVHGIVTKAGGFIEVSSELGLGSTFDVWLPLSADKACTTEVTTVARQGGRETIVLVEDEQMVLRFTTKLLERLGYQVRPFASAEMALAELQGGATFDLLLTDILLPGIDGHELYRRVVTARGHFPVVFMSGYTANLLAEKGLQEAGAAFLQKPFSHDELAAKVRAALDAHAVLGFSSG